MSNRRLRINHIISVSLSLMLFAAPSLAQQPATAALQTSAQLNEITFDDLLAVDAFKMYGEVRNVGQLLGNGGAGEIVEPIIKLAEPGKEFQSIIDFLKKNSEALASSRLMFATWPTRTDLPNVFVAIEFPTKDEADKFAPKLETFLPTVLPPVPVTPEGSPEPKGTSTPESAGSPSVAKPTPLPTPKVTLPAPRPAVERLPFVITHSGTLVFIADKAFKLEKLHPQTSPSLFRDPNFRTVHDKFTSEPIFFFFNVALEDKTKPQPSPAAVVSEAESPRIKAQEKDDSPDEPLRADSSPEPTPQEMQTAVLIAGPERSPAPTPTKEQEAQQIASLRVSELLDAIGYGEPQWPEAVGLAIELSGSEYVVRALMIDKPDARRTPIPFVPQLLSGSPYATEAASVLPDDTDMFVSASIDLTKTYEGMKKEAETRAKAELGKPKSQRYENGVLVEQGPVRTEVTDPFAAFEAKAGFKIKDDLLSALGSEIAIAGSLKTLMGAGVVNLGIRTDSTASANESSGDKSGGQKKPEPALPVILIEVRDRDAARKLMPKVLTGLGIGEANLIAQTERRGDTEMVNYAGVFAYGFVGNFLVISDALSVRKVIDANLNSQTLSSNTVFRNSRRWESSRTLGQLYVSPALMQSYHDQIRKQAAAMDQAMRDFLLGLDPRSEAITYALSNDGPGMQHELHLPKNLILTMVAGISSSVKNPPPEANEGIAMGMLGFIANSEAQYKAGPGKGNYGSLQQMIDGKMFPPDVLEKYGYNFQITVTGDQFEAVATPRDYGRTGKRSFFVDKSGVVRGGDHGGGPATIADPPAQP